MSLEFDEVALGACEPFTRSGPTAIVDVCGPLMSRSSPFFDSYESVVARCRAAFDSDATSVLLRIDSPGGLVSGCLAAARELRAIATAAGKPLVAYVDETATSAAYALACAASRVVVPPTGRVGSIGVIECLPSFARAEQAAGVDVTVIMSGARKADGNPSLPMTDEARAALQQGVDQMARAFCELVASHRGGTADQFANLQAAVYYGADAVTQRLADEVSELPALLAALANPKDPTRMTLAEAVAGLKAAAEGDGEDAAKAKRMLAAYEAPPAEDDEEESDDKKAKAEGEEEDMPMSEKEPSATVAALAAQVQALASESAARKAADAAKLKKDRDALFASRPDVAPEVFAALASASLESCTAALAKIPRPDPAAAASVAGTRGASATGATGSAATLTERQLKICKEQNIDPEEYARTLATYAPQNATA